MYLNICYLYPKTLNLYGDRGNILSWQKRCQWRNIQVFVEEVELGEKADLFSFDLFFLGGGQDSDQLLVIQDLKERREDLQEILEGGRVLLAICGGYQLLGHYYQTKKETMEGLKIFPIHTKAGTKRLIGNALIKVTSSSEDFTLVGFENHSGQTYLQEEVQPLGEVLVGYGNNGEDKGEGCRLKNFFGTYLHGPLLPKNPHFADYLLLLALERRYPQLTLAPLDDFLEMKAHEKAVKMTRQKK